MKAIVPAIVLACFPIVAAAATEQHAVNYSYALDVNGDVYPKLTFPGFDDQGGTRTLTRVDLNVRADVSATLAIENMNPTPLENWTLEGQHLVLAGFERADSKMPGPFAFLGGLNFATFTSPLAAHDGTAGSGADYLERRDSTSIDSTLDMDPFFNDFFNGGGEVTAIVGPFTEFFLGDASQYDPTMGTGDATVDFTALAQSGTITLSYTYTVVPEPMSAAVVLSAPLLGRRRR